MEKSITNKMTFYDIVTLVVPSALVCYSYEWKPLGHPDNLLSKVAYFGVVLMVGLLLKSLGSFWSSFWFRNNTYIIEQEQQNVTNIGIDLTKCRLLDILFFDPMKFIVGPLMKVFYSPDRSKLNEYFSKYEGAYNDNYYGKRIEILESHVAFLQTWVMALVVFLFEKLDFACCIIVTCYLSIVLMIAIQRKIYSMVWESKE